MDDGPVETRLKKNTEIRLELEESQVAHENVL